MNQRRLLRRVWLSIAAGIATISLKLTAWLLTGSVGLLSDAAESVVNLVAAVVAMAALRWAAKPADEEHAYGHTKAEYFSAGVEGTLILVAAVGIAIAAADRLVPPQPIGDVEIGLTVAALAAVINLVIGLMLLRAGRQERSILVEADGRHLMTDVWTSVGVIAGVAGVAVTGWQRLDALVALAVALNILLAGGSLVRRSAGGLMDRALDQPERTQVDEVLAHFETHDVRFHALRTRQAGARAFISVHVLVPGAWSVQHGHDVVEEVELALRERMPYATVFTHLEPAEDARSFEDTTLDRRRPARD